MSVVAGKKGKNLSGKGADAAAHPVHGIHKAPTSINGMKAVRLPSIFPPSKAVVELRGNLLQWTKYKTYFIQKFLYMTYGFKYLSFYVIATMFR